MNSEIPSYTHIQTKETKFSDYIAVIIRQYPVILLSVISLLASIIFYTEQIQDVYQSYSTLVIEEPTPVATQSFGIRTRAKTQSYYEGILNSRTYLDMVVDTIGLELFRKPFPKMTKEGAREYIRSHISLKKTTYEGFLRLTAQARTKELAYSIASTATTLFHKRCQEVESEETRRTVVAIDNQLKVIRKKLEKAEHDYRTFQDKVGNILEGRTPELKTLQDAYAEDFAQLGLKTANLKAEKKQLAKLEAIITPTNKKTSPQVLKLRSKLRELEKEKMRLESIGIRGTMIDREISNIEKQLLQQRQNTSTQKPNSINPNIVKQWQNLRKSVIEKEAELALHKQRLKSYENAIASYKRKNPDILTKSLELLKLKRAKEIYEDVYNNLLEQSEEQRIRSVSSSAGIKIVDTARMPENPMPKNKLRYHALGLLLGLLLGVSLAFLIELNDTTIKSTEDIEKLFHKPVLGTIPHIAHNKKDNLKIKRRSESSKYSNITTRNYPKNLLDFEGSDSVTTESYRSLRTNLSFVSPDNPLKTVLLTSAGPSEGKSLTICNLTMAYAQMGKKTLLVDADLRRPMLHHLFNTKRENGFADLFIDSPNYNNIIKQTQKKNLYLITAGMFTPNPAELIASQKMIQHINYFKENFDIIFFDTPPVVAVTDASLLGTKLDGALLVIRSHKTDKEIVSRAFSSLEKVGTKVLGTVLNDIDLSHRYSSYGYYKYYYHYYKSKKD